MFRSLVWLGLGGSVAACAGAAPPPQLVHVGAREPERLAPPAAPTPPAPEPDACRAQPSTVYGDEAVLFELQGPASVLPIAVRLVDERGRLVHEASAPLPGQWRPPALPSGDFRLQLGSNGASCVVTVNRELSRATERAR
ncbi:MAG TPA: hypothetical protein VHP33_08750 [Polyangiaceae bacterium]|nr:hypothetical protein [Polyangiaceae bacterium]